MIKWFLIFESILLHTHTHTHMDEAKK